jgi:hypothetical protein
MLYGSGPLCALMAQRFSPLLRHRSNATTCFALRAAMNRERLNSLAEKSFALSILSQVDRMAGIGVGGYVAHRLQLQLQKACLHLQRASPTAQP